MIPQCFIESVVKAIWSRAFAEEEVRYSLFYLRNCKSLLQTGRGLWRENRERSLVDRVSDLRIKRVRGYIIEMAFDDIKSRVVF